MKILFVAFVIALLSPNPAPSLVHHLVVLPSSTLEVEGTTNVNSYKCAISRYTGSDTLVLHESGKGIRPVFVKGAVSLDASGVDCGMALMTSDFRKAINLKEHPAIIVDFISFERMPKYTSVEEPFKGIMTISLGGVKKLFEVPCNIDTGSGTIHLVGSHEFLFSDFNLTPPTRMLGAVKVNESLKVTFRLNLLLN
jgi:hypothetical protein